MFVMTVDQRRSRRDIDRVEGVLESLNEAQLVRPFERTAGDELQGVLDDPATTVTLALNLIQEGHWSVGIGIGAVRLPLPEATRAGHGQAFEAARDAVTRAKNSLAGVAITGPDAESARHAETALALLGILISRRSEQGHEAVALVAQGMTQADAAAQLGVSKQAVSQRLAAASWHIERPARELAIHLLQAAAQ
ncbi:SatD family protein [Hoyosella sp. YIM 151337]|uniref:SatD family protein n=1 Tax=Hoyosella sp. YIM 151337 TaxID=2992742 RepID=UPI0022367074|nr:SatD family protein [Hoyosella sp. YIM 151337]MCW4353139.1 SatD family protein [Hoyosella sp. YIM 151337]